MNAMIFPKGFENGSMTLANPSRIALLGGDFAIDESYDGFKCLSEWGPTIHLISGVLYDNNYVSAEILRLAKKSNEGHLGR